MRDINCQVCRGAVCVQFRDIDWTWSLHEKEPWMTEESLPPGMSSKWKRCPGCKGIFELNGFVLMRVPEVRINLKQTDPTPTSSILRAMRNLVSRLSCGACYYNEIVRTDNQIRCHYYAQGVITEPPQEPVYEECKTNHDRAYLKLVKES